VKRFTVDEEERTHYHIQGYFLPVNKEDVLMLIPEFLDYYSEERHCRDLKKSIQDADKRYRV